jgi:tetratricopeptide (TPR) repeat protein
MTLAEDELVEEEMLAPAISEEDEAEAVEFEATIVESIPPEEAAVEVEIEDLEPAIPAWAFAQAIEPAMPIAQEEPVDTTIGPDTVFLTEEEEAEVRVTQERITAPEPAEAALVEEQPAAEEAPPDDVESVQPPTWVALEEEPEAQIEAAAPKVQEVELEMIEPEDDESRLTYARQLWAKGKKADARDEYENLLRTPLRDEATADLERWAAEAPDEPLLRLLGDAYIKQDRLDEALEAYRRALSSL